MADPPPHDQLMRLSDAELVAHARERMLASEAGLETAKRCVAVVFARHHHLVRALCAQKARPGEVDDLEAAVYARFVHAAYLQSAPMTNPAGLLTVMARRVIANHYARGTPDAVPLDQLADAEATERGYEEVELSEIVGELLAVLTPRQREVVWLRIERDLSSAEIARRLETTPGNVDVIF